VNDATLTFSKIIYIDTSTDKVIRELIDISAIPIIGNIVSFTTIADKYSVVSIDYQMCNHDIVIECQKI
jgi:hypothetical protein